MTGFIETLGPMLAANPPSRLDALARLSGRLHVVVVHFPVALLIVAAMFEFFRSRRESKGPSPAALRCVAVGAVSAIVAAAMGWLNADYEISGTPSAVVWWHRWLGIAAAAVAVLTWLAAMAAARRKDGGVGRAFTAYRLLLVVGAGLVGVAGHFGGRLTHGDDYLTNAIAAVFNPLPSAPVPPQGSPVDPQAPGANTDPNAIEVRAIAILEHSCTSCHGRDKTKGGLSLLTREAALRGGKNGPAIASGQPDLSELIARLITDDIDMRMPADADPLPDDQVETLREWIRQGAKWPEGSAAAVDQGPHWSYRPIASVAVGGVSRNPIDVFVGERLKRDGLSSSPEADRATLIRRVSLDLIGLPPTIPEVDDFLSDSADGAYARVVDRLLASPRYGEHWATWWLDQARYADSHGYEKDTARIMWPYRDWVIDALNADMPFDRFTIEQLAGDLLPEPTTAQLIATAFNRNTMINEEGGADPEEYRVAAVVDRVNTTAAVWLGTTLACAQCHDHKYDAFSIKDYYRFFAFFNNTPAETQQRPDADIQIIAHKLTLPEPRREEWERDLAAAEAEIKRINDDKSPEHAAAKARADQLRASIAAIPTVQVMKELDPPRATHILQRGSFLSPGEEVTSDTPGTLPKMRETWPRNRLGLAKWIMDPENPLTARVTVNRVWAAHFGTGLVATDEDFGTRGEKPTHPELLDTLAAGFRNGWSLKQLHRTIVTSATYKQSSSMGAAMIERDPANRLLARGPRFRLDAETIRDQALSVSGLLSERTHGPSVFPKQPPGIWSTPHVASHWTDSTGEDARRRSVYTFWKRSTPYTGFVAFDAPQRTVSCTRRTRTNTPLQALTTLNDPVFMQTAAGLARRIITEGGRGGAPSGRIVFAFRACLARAPTEAELGRLLALHRQQAESFAASPTAARELVAGLLPEGTNGFDERELAAWTIVANVLMNLDEFLTRG